MGKLTDEEVGKEFIILQDNKFNESLKKIIRTAIRGYFDRGKRANKLIDRLDLQIKKQSIRYLCLNN